MTTKQDRGASTNAADDIELHPNNHSRITVDSQISHRSNHSTPKQADQLEEVVSEGGYGWVVVLCVFLLNASSWGTNSAYGVILAYYLSNNTFPDATHLDYAFVCGLTLSQALLSTPLTTICSRHFGTRTTLTVGNVLMTGAFVSASFATQKWHLYITQGILPGWGMGFLFVGSAGLIPQWFTKKRSLANGIATSGVGIGGILFNLVIGAVIKSAGVAWSFRTLAIGSFVINTISTILVRDRNDLVKPSQVAFDFPLLRRKEFLLLVGWGFLSEFGYVVMWFTMPAFAVSIGLDTQQSSIVGAVLNVGLIAGRPLLGYYSDTFGRINIITIVTGLSGLLCLFFWTFVKSYPALLVFALLIGAFCGVFWATISPMVPEVVGLQGVPGAFSMLFLIMVIPSLFAEPIALTISESSHGNFLHAQIFVGCVYVGAAMCAWFLRPWKIRQLEILANSETASLTHVNSNAGRKSQWGRSHVKDVKWVLKQLVSPKRI